MTAQLNHMDGQTLRTTYSIRVFGLSPLMFTINYNQATGFDLPVSNFVEYGMYRFTRYNNLTMLPQRPAADEYNPYYDTYVRLVPDEADPIAQLRTQPAALKTLLGGLTNEQALYRYAPGKWSIKESLVHIIDTERIFSYRALRIGRGDQTPLPGFEQNDYVPASGADARPLADIWAEYDAVRAGTLALLNSFTDEAFARIGTASGGPVSVRALAYILPGHEAHHIGLFRDRYVPGLV